MGERVQEMNPVDIGERVQEMNSDDMGERVNEMNPDDMGERLTDMNPDGMGESLPEMNPDELMLNYDRVDENVEVAHQSHTMPPQEVIETIIDAAGSRNYTRVIHLIDHCVDLPVQYIDYKGNNLLHMVLYTYIRAYLTEDSDEIIREYHGTHKDELLQCVMKLVKAGVDVNHPNKDKQTPIFIAARYGLHNIVVYLIDHGVDVHYIDKNQNNVLHLVFESYTSIYEYHKIDRGESLHCIIKLVEAGVDISHMVKDEETLMIKTENKKRWYNIISLIDHHHVDIHFINKRQTNTLHVVFENYVSSYRTRYRDEISGCQTEFVVPRVHDLNKSKETPLSLAVICKLYKVLMNVFLPDAHVDYVLANDQGFAHHVIYNRHDINKEDEPQYVGDLKQVVRTLINMRVDVNKPDIDGNTPLFNIVSYQTPTTLLKRSNILFRLQYNLITALVFDGCNVNYQNKHGQTPLMYYIRHLVDIRILKLVIPLSDVHLTDTNGDTACSYCVQYYILNNTNLFKLYPLSVLMSPINGVKLFHQILTCKRLELLHYYMRLQLIVSGVTTEGENMLHLLARVKYDYSQDKFNWLFNKKLDINHRCSKTNTPIMVAALLLNSKYLELFTRHPRIDINAQNNQGHTALHLCIIGFTMVKDGLDTRQENDVIEDYCSHKYLMYMECVDILLAVGIDVNTQDGGGRTALMMAAMKNDRFLIRKLLNAGAMVNCNGKSALHHLDIYESVFDLNFKLLVSAGDNMLLNLPCIDGNTLIQAALCFPRCWEPRTAVSFIKYLVGENCCLQSLITSSVESSYNQIDMRELSSQERDKLRKLLYLSGAPENQIVATLNFEKEDTNVERYGMMRLLYLRRKLTKEIVQHEDGFYSRHKELFTNYCCNISLMSQCRRLIRQKLGLGITEKVVDLELPRELNDFLLLKDVLRPKDYSIVNIDDGWNDFEDDDGYDGYDIVKDRDDDYSQYNYQYFTLNTDDDLTDEFSKTGKYPNGEHAYIYL